MEGDIFLLLMIGDQSGEAIKVNKKMRYIFSKFKTHIIILIYMRWGIKLEDIQPFILESKEEEIEVPMDYYEINTLPLFYFTT